MLVVKLTRKDAAEEREGERRGTCTGGVTYLLIRRKKRGRKRRKSD